VSALGDNDGVAVANRRPKHQHTVYDPGHTHQVGHDNQYQSGTSNNKPGLISGTNDYQASASATTGVKVNPEGASSSSSPTDAPAYLVVNMIIKT
jgi:hypothetical protein